MKHPFERGDRTRSIWNQRLHGAFSASVVTGLIAMLVSSTIFAAGPVAAQDEDDPFLTATVAPESALGYFSFALDEASEQWTMASELLDRAGLGDLLDQAIDDALSSADADSLPFDAFLGGQAAIVLSEAALELAADASAGMASADFGVETPVASDDPSDATGVALILEARAPDTAYLGITQALEDQATSAGSQVETADYEGVEIQSVSADPDSDDTPLAIARLENDLILVGGAPADLEPVIDVNAGSTPALADFQPFSQLRETLSGDFLMYGFVNGVAAAEAQIESGVDPFGLGAAGTEITGLDQYTAMLLRADTPGMRIETAAIAAEGSQLPPVGENFTSEMLQQAPGNALVFLNGTDLGQTGILDAIGLVALVAAMGQAGGAATPTPDMSQEDYIAEVYEQAAAMIGFNLQTDLFRQLAGEFGLWVSGSADPQTIAGLFVSDVVDSPTVVNALAQVTLLIQGAGGGETNVTTRQVEGTDISVVESGDGTIPDVEYGVVSNQLLIGVGEAIDAFVSGPSDSLADNEQFQTAMETLPADNRGTFYLDLAQLIPLIQSTQDSVSSETLDADPACADYATQEEAQAAYDEDSFDNADLDQDFDGEACEDFFNGGGATPEAAATADYSAIKAFATVVYDEDEVRRSSSILYIEE